MWRTDPLPHDVVAAIAAAAARVVSAVTVVAAPRAQLTDNLDEGLIGRADEIAVLLAADPCARAAARTRTC